MKKIIVVITFFLLWNIANSQIYLPNPPVGYGNNFNRINPQIALHLPIFSDTASSHTNISNPQIGYYNGAIYAYYDGHYHLMNAGIGSIPSNILDFDSTLGGGFFQVGGIDRTAGVNHEIVAFLSDLNDITGDTLVDNGFPTQVLNILDTPLADATDSSIYLIVKFPRQKLADSSTNPFYTHGNDATQLIDGAYTFFVPSNNQTVTNAANLGFYQYYQSIDLWKKVNRPFLIGGGGYKIDQNLFVKDAYSLVFGTSNLERGRFTSSGNFRINSWQHSGSSTDSDWSVMALPDGTSYVKRGTTLTVDGTTITGDGTPDNPLVSHSIGGGGSGSNDPDSLGGLAANDYEVKINKQTTLDNSTTHYPSTSAVKTEINGDTTLLHGQIALLNSQQAKNNDSLASHNTRIINEAIARDNADIKTVAVTGTTTKTVTLTKGDASTITTTFTDQTGSGGGIDSVRRKSYASDSVLQYSSGTGTYAFRTAREVHVKDFSPYGGDSVHDETTYFQTAVNYADSVDAVLIIDKPKVYWKIAGAIDATCKCQIKIPPHSDASRKVFTIKGDKQTSPLPVGGALSAHGTTKTYSGSKLVSTISSGTDADSHVFGTAASLTTLVASDFGIEVHAPAIIGGIGWKLGGDMDVERFTFYSDTDVYDSPQPVLNVSGIETPDGSRTENYIVAYNTVIGVKTGILFGEHAHILYNKVYGCVNAYATKPGGHRADGIGNLSQWSVNDIYVGSGNPLAIEWNSFGVEAATSPVVGNKWYINQWQLNDSLNGLNGIIWYRVDTSNQSGNYTKFIKNGGAYVNAFYLNGDSTAFAKLHAANPIFQQTVGTAPEVLTTIGSFWSGVLAVGASAKYALLTNRFGGGEFSIYDTVLQKARATLQSNGDWYMGGTTSALSTSCLKLTNSTGATEPQFDLIFNNGTGILQKSTGRIGIGTLSPADPLHIQGSSSSNIELLVENTNASGQANTRVKNNSGTLGQLGIYGSSASGFGSIVSNSVYVYSNGAALTFSENAGGPINFDIGSGTPTQRMVISSAGAVRMNNYGAGTATFDASGNITSVSDVRLKRNIQPFNTGLKALMNINPITYKWNKKSGNEMDSTYAGFSAQNVKANIPYGTGVSKDGYLSLQDRAIMATLVNAVKEQQKEIEDLKKEIKQLKHK